MKTGLLLFGVDPFEKIETFNYSTESHKVFIEALKPVESYVELTEIAVFGLSSESY